MELQNWFVKHSQPRDTDLLSELGIEEQSTLHCYFQTISPQKIPDVRSLYAPPLPPPTGMLSCLIVVPHIRHSN